jgi:lysyl-tRNA synthetase class 2
MGNRPARWIGLTVELIGLGTLVSCLLPEWRDRLHLVNDLFTPELTGAASGLAALAGVTLVLVGRGVAGRRRIAWLVAVLALGAATIAHLVKGLDVEAAAVTAGCIGILVWRRKLFIVQLGPARGTKVVRVALLALSIDVAYGVAGLLLHRRVVADPALTIGNTLIEVAARLVGLPGPLRVEGRFGHWFPTSLTGLGLLTMVAVLSTVLAPIALAGSGSESELAEATALTDRADGDTLDPFVLRRDKRRVFSVDRQAVVGYRYVRGIGLAAGDPVGESSAFLGLCARLGWRPAIIGVREDRLPLYLDIGLRSIYIGDEAIIDVLQFDLVGRTMRNARQAVQRSRNACVSTEFRRERELDPGLRDELLAVSDAQRDGQREFGFSMTLGGLFSGDYPDCLVAIARDHEGQPVAFQRYIPCRAGKALSLDIMRRRPDAPNGVHERLIVDSVEWARQRRMDEVSLNFAAFRDLLDDASPGAVRSALARLLQSFDGRLGLQLDTLRRFNAKFRPRWVRRYLVYQAHTDLPAIGVAALSAEGFLPLDPGRERPADVLAPRSAGGQRSTAAAVPSGPVNTGGIGTNPLVR